MRIDLSTFVLLGLGLVTTAEAGAETVRFTTASHLPRASAVETVYAADCPSGSYRLAVSAEKGSVILHDGRRDIDLTATTVGARLLEQDVLVSVGFNCPLDALNIFLKGAKLVDLGAPVGFRDHLTVRSNGAVSASSPRPERLDQMARIPMGVSVIADPKPAGQ